MLTTLISSNRQIELVKRSGGDVNNFSKVHLAPYVVKLPKQYTSELIFLYHDIELSSPEEAKM